MKLNENVDIYLDDCLNVIKTIPNDSIDLIVTSPPYDNLRTYNGNIKQWNFNKFQDIAEELYRVTKQGGVIVWIVSDATINGSETGMSFKQALYFKEIGFNLHDTMIWEKDSFTATGTLKVRYASVFEYMFVLSKGKVKTFNPIKDKKNVSFGRKHHGTVRQPDGSVKPISNANSTINEYGQRYNVWYIIPERSNKNRVHPAVFPIKLAHDHIISWSNENDIVLDPFMGSGTTGIACINTNRKFIGIEIDEKYFDIAKERLEKSLNEAQNT